MSETTAPPPWQNRITGSGHEAPDQLLANPRNVRRHPPFQAAALTGVLEQVGWVQDVIVNQRSGFLVDGHLRVELALRHGQPTIPVSYVDLSPEDEALILASLDPIAALATTDAAALAALLADVATTQPDILALLDQVRAAAGVPRMVPLTDPDDVPAVPETPITQPGDLWLLGEHRVLCGDATSASDVVRLMGSARAALMATDPPYLVKYDGGSHPQSWHNRPEVKDKHWDDYHEGDGVGFFASFIRLAVGHALTDNPAMYQWHADMRRTDVVQAWKDNGLLPHQIIVWAKARPVLTRSHYMWQHEPCLYGWIQGKPPTHKPPAAARTVWDINQQGESDGIHPTQKPVETAVRPIEYRTRPGDVVYEPFAGSGTTVIAAELLARHCYALELSPAFCDVIVARWEAFTGEVAIRQSRAEVAA